MRPPTIDGEQIIHKRPVAGPTSNTASEAVSAHKGYGQRIREARWQLGFVGLVGYFIVEYSQLQLMYPILQPLRLGKVVVLLAALGWLVAPKTTGLMSPGTRRIDKLFLLLVFAVFWTVLFAHYPSVAWTAFPDVLRYLMVYFLISRLAENSWRLRAISFVWVLLNFKMGQHVCRAYAMYRAHGANEMTLASHGVGGTGWFGNSADMGVAMCAIWPVALCLLFSKRTGIYKYMLIGASIACLGAILLCGSRGAVVGAAAIVMAALVKNPKKIAASVMVVLFALGLFLVLPSASVQRFHSALTPTQDETAHHRLELWKAGLRMWRDNPLLGVGLANYPRVRWSHYPISLNNGIMSVAHNLYVQGFSELGIVGMLPMIALWLAFFRLNASTRRMVMQVDSEGRHSFEYCLAVGLDLGLIGYFASGTFVAVLWYPHIFVFLGMGAALNNVVWQKHLAASPQRPKPTSLVA